MKRFFCLFAAALLTTAIVSCKKPKEVTVTEVTLDKITLSLYRGGTDTLRATVLPDEVENKAVKWTSSNSEMVTVDNNGIVIAKKVGTAVVTVTTEEGGKTAKCTITVLHPAEPAEMAQVDGGTFTMGAAESDADALSDEKPAHKVTLSSFKISKWLVTREQWKMIMGDIKPSPSHHYHDNNLPVEQVSFDDVKEFIRRLNDSTGRKYRLPTEAEWEYAARGGKEGVNSNYKYSGSDDLKEVAWYADNSKDVSRPTSEQQTWPVGRKNPNKLGIYDMSGNVEEWCSDWYVDYTPEAQTNPQGPEGDAALGKQYRVTRGGCYSSTAPLCRVTARKATYSPLSTTNVYKTVGFRLALP